MGHCHAGAGSTARDGGRAGGAGGGRDAAGCPELAGAAPIEPVVVREGAAGGGVGTGVGAGGMVACRAGAGVAGLSAPPESAGAAGGGAVGGGAGVAEGGVVPRCGTPACVEPDGPELAGGAAGVRPVFAAWDSLDPGGVRKSC